MTGPLHFAAAMLALAVGASVLGSPKGTARHRLLGRVYGAAMLTVNLLALVTYGMTGRMNAFHWLALVSLATLLAGLVPVLSRRPRGGWLELHARFMAWSYVGLLAAGISQLASRADTASTGRAVLIASVLVCTVGAWLIERRVPAAIRRTAGGH